MQQALVTGASGFIGRHLVATLLDRGVRVRCVVRPSSRTDHLQHPLVELLDCPLTSADGLRKAVDRVDVVFHLAGLTHAVKNSKLNCVNGDLCAAISDACRRSDSPPCLIFLSSIAAAGPATDRKSVQTESDLPNPISFYGKSKRLGEIEIQKRAGDLPCSIVRPGIVFGGHDSGMVTMFKPIYRYRLHVTVGFRTPPLSLIYVKDLMRLILEVAQRGERLDDCRDGSYSSNGYYFACDDSEHPNYWQLGTRIASALDRSVFVWPLWLWVARSIAGANQLANYSLGRSTLLNIDKIREAAVISWACSSEKARRHFGFTPATDLDTALQETAKWYLDNNWI